MQNSQKTYRYLYKLPISVPLLILFVMIILTDKITLARLLKTNGVILIVLALGIVLISEFVLKKVVYYYCHNGKFSNKQLVNANQKAKWVVYVSIIALVFCLGYVRYLIKMPI